MKKKIRANPDRPYYLLLYPAALFLSILWVSFYGSPLPYLVFYTVLLSLPFWLLYVLIIFLTLRIYQSTPDVFCTKGESVPFEIQLENTGLLPMGELSFEWEERLASYEDVPAQARFSLRPGEKLTLNGNLRCLYAGTYPVGILRIRVNGPFGIAHFRFRMPSELRLCVRPIIEESSDVRKLREALASDRSKAYREDVLPGNDLRRYVPGDRLNRIHWKASARQGELPKPHRAPSLLKKSFEETVFTPMSSPQCGFLSGWGNTSGSGMKNPAGIPRSSTVLRLSTIFTESLQTVSTRRLHPRTCRKSKRKAGMRCSSRYLRSPSPKIPDFLWGRLHYNL